MNYILRDYSKTGIIRHAKKHQGMYDDITVQTLTEENRKEDFPDTLLGYTTSENADLLVLLKENRNFLERITRGSRMKKLIRESTLPLLIFHEHNKN